VRARVPIVLLTLAVAAALGFWARRVAGPGGGLLALALAAFQPSFVAHGHLLTTDMPVTAAMLLATWTFMWFWQKPDILRAALVALTVTVAVLTRLTAAILVPVFVALAVVEWLRATDRRRVLRGVSVLALAHLVLTPFVIWAAYRFRYAPFPGDAGAYGDWPRGVAALLVRWTAQHHLLPQPFLEGLRFQIEHNQYGHYAYLLGDRGSSGWWYYYLVVFVAKNTPAFLAVAALALWQTARRARSMPIEAVYWLAPAAAIFVAASAGHIQIGERYILAMYPFLILWIAVSVAPLLSSRVGRIVLVSALAVHAVSTLSAAPRGFLTYFNPVAERAAARGEPWVADSNLDWGQDLPRLAEWMRRNGIGRVQLAYFGSDDPDRYGIAHDDLPTWHSHHPVHVPVTQFRGTVVVSPNLLLGFLMPPGKSPYDFLLDRKPDARVGCLFVYRLPE
jgi:4-amino-4-deoxy-L-arabinose transferase-like glycosyltransferase